MGWGGVGENCRKHATPYPKSCKHVSNQTINETSFNQSSNQTIKPVYVYFPIEYSNLCVPNRRNRDVTQGGKLCFGGGQKLRGMCHAISNKNASICRNRFLKICLGSHWYNTGVLIMLSRDIVTWVVDSYGEVSYSIIAKVKIQVCSFCPGHCWWTSRIFPTSRRKRPHEVSKRVLKAFQKTTPKTIGNTRAQEVQHGPKRSRVGF